MKYVGLMDCNNFFVSCERLFRPDLQNKPTLVLSSNDGCVVARSQEIKDMGIPMGVPYFKVKDIIKDSKTAVFSSNFLFYRDLSARVYDSLSEQVPTVEQYSIDESFFYLNADSNTDVEREALSIKNKIERQTGIPVSIGVASNKTLAKLASKFAKKDKGVFVLDTEKLQKLALEVPLYDIWGIGINLNKSLQSNNVATVADYLALDVAVVRKLYGVVGERLWLELSGKLINKVCRKKTIKQSITHSRSFNKPIFTKSVIEDALSYHTRMAAEDLRSMNLVATGVKIFIMPSRHGDYVLQGLSANIIFDTPTDDTFVMLDNINKVLNGIYKASIPYKKAGITLFGLIDKSSLQNKLFNNAVDKNTLLNTLDNLNKKFGKDFVKIGDRQKSKMWQTKADKLSPAYTTRWSDIPTVSA